MAVTRELRVALAVLGVTGSGWLSVPTDIGAQDAAVTARQEKIDHDFLTQSRPLVQEFCSECHSATLAEADVNLDQFATAAAARAETGTWLKVRRMLRERQMPPPDAPQMSDDQTRLLLGWTEQFLRLEAESLDGDPGPVQLRRLSNSEYTASIQDLTGVATLEPAAEFPVDGAAGEGFTNTGSGQGMSPALVQKYLDAGKEVASHAMLTPTGIRFTPETTRRDQTNALIADIQAFYGRYTSGGGGEQVNLQGIVFDTNEGGLLPVKEYLAALLETRNALHNRTTSIEIVAAERNLSPIYLGRLWASLEIEEVPAGGGVVSDLLRRWRASEPADVDGLVREITGWQKSLWKFNPVGHIGREGGATAWMEPVSGIVDRQELRLPLSASSQEGDVRVTFRTHQVAPDQGECHVVWEQPRLEFAEETQSGPLLLRDLRAVTTRTRALFASEGPRTAEYLQAAAELRQGAATLADLASARGLHPGLLAQWGATVGFEHPPSLEIPTQFADRLTRIAGQDAVRGWGSDATPSLSVNASDADISFSTLRIPARGVVVHPSPTLESVIVWRSPIDAQVVCTGRIADMDPNCGNGVTWRIEHHTSTGVSVLCENSMDNGGAQSVEPTAATAVAAGDLLFLVVNARDQNHICDTTFVDWTIADVRSSSRRWNLSEQIVDRIHEGNPLSDAAGNKAVWHFCAAEPAGTRHSGFPADSSLERWRNAVIAHSPPEEQSVLAHAVAQSLTAVESSVLSESDRAVREQLVNWHGPLRWLDLGRADPGTTGAAQADAEESKASVGLEARHFGPLQSEEAVGAADLCIAAATMAIPRELTANANLVTAGRLAADSRRNGAAQFALTLGDTDSTGVIGGAPVVAAADGGAMVGLRADEDWLRDHFPPALCYVRIVPVDEVVTLQVFYREDELLKQLMLSEAECAELDRLWDDLLYVSEEPFALAVSFEQIAEFATQDRPDMVIALEPLRKPINDRAEAFRARLKATEPVHVAAVLEFASRAWRRPLTDLESSGLENLYQQLRASDVAHTEAVHLLIARVLTSPAFLYKREQPPAGTESGDISALELATRLSYFLWSSVPDAELRAVAESGALLQEDVLRAQTLRMLKDPRARRLAENFACQWLHLRDFDQNDDKNEALFPEFAGLKDDMYEETVRFFEEMIRNDGSVLDLVEADHTFLNRDLAAHYGIPGVEGDAWRRVTGLRAAGRGGVLGMATVLASQSGASRTSPILRGNWVYETLLGERLPRPPANVPQLPDNVPAGLTERQLIEQHSAVEACARCHERIDPYGFALEQFDPIGRLRTEPADTRTTLFSGEEIDGLAGLRDYLATTRRDDLLRQFCRKLLGFALGREVQLSDEPLLDRLVDSLAANDHAFRVAAVEIVLSPQFRRIRGADAAASHLDQH